MKNASPNGFSLVEVVLALGIVSFALVPIIGLFATIMDNDKEIAERRELVESIDPLNNFLQNKITFDQVFTWAQATNPHKELVYVTYHGISESNPSPTGDDVFSSWLDTDTDSPAQYTASRAGYWVRAKLSLSSTNPETDLTGFSATTYPHAYIVLDVELESLPPDPAIEMPINAKLTVPVTILR